MSGADEKNVKAIEKKDKGSTVNPYIEHKDIQDDRNRNDAIGKFNWQVAWRITSALLAISIGFNGYYMTQSKFIPVIVAMDKMGHLVVVGPVDKAQPVDSKRIIRGEVMAWIENSRAITTDGIFQKSLIENVYARVGSTSKARTQLDEYYRARKVNETAKTQTVVAEITLALPTAGDTWQVEWSETWRNVQGEILRIEHWKAILTTKISPLGTEEGIKANPAGFFINDFNWSKQI